jgi:hypothetical protein
MSLAFDPAASGTACTGDATFAEVERLRDTDRTLFGPVDFNTSLAWTGTFAVCFGSDTPESGVFLLHVASEAGEGTPVLLVPGAGDNAPRAFPVLAPALVAAGHPTYAITFAHPHGDVLRHAEIVADAIARIRARTGAAKVDVVAHSKGGVDVAVYLSGNDADFGDPAWTAAGTRYRGDVDKAVFLASPLGGIDTAFRWPDMNLASLDWDTAIAPTSWGEYYPYGVANWAYRTDLGAQDFLPDGGDLFAGQRQLLARQDYPLPGELPWLGAYAAQLDWYTTYEGGVGYDSVSAGIDDVIAAGGDVIATLAAHGLDTRVRTYALAGTCPLMPTAVDTILTAQFGEAFADMATANADAWGAFVAAGAVPATADDIQGLASGNLMVGEVTGPSDGLVFVSSAEALAGAEQIDEVELSHLDMLVASPETGQALIDAATTPGEAWKRALGERYVAADSVGWVVAALADAGGPDDTDDTGSGGDDTGVGDTGVGGDTDDTDVADDTGDTDRRGAGPAESGGCGCDGAAVGPVWAAWAASLLGAVGAARRRART